MVQFKPTGVYPAMPTPFDDNGQVNEDVLKTMVSWLVSEGVDGLFPLGSTGEFIHLTYEEKAKVIKVIIDETKNRVPVTPGTTESCALNCIKMIKIARDLGCSAAVIAPPYYLTASQSLVEEHYEQIIKALDGFPIILYNIPVFSTPINYEVVEKLSRHSSVVGMKDSSGSMVDFMHYMDVVRLADAKLNMLVGREEMLFSALEVGAKGTMAATACVVPEIMTNIYNSWIEGNKIASLKMQFSLLQLTRTMFIPPFPLGFKAALEIRGFNMGKSMRPLSKADLKNYEIVKCTIEKALKQLLNGKVKVI